MPGYQFQTTITLENPNDKELIVSIPRGTLIEPKSTHLTYQSAIISKDYIFRLNPKEVRSVILDAECWNKNLSPPRKIQGQITSLKGNIKTETDIWLVSSKPKSDTISISPSQDAHVYSALTNSDLNIAQNFLSFAIDHSHNDGNDIEKRKKELYDIKQSRFSSQKKIKNLCNIANDPQIHPYVSAKYLRNFLISNLPPTWENMRIINKMVRNVYALTSHQLARNLYNIVQEVAELDEKSKFEIQEENQEKFKSIARNKYNSLLDALPLLDEVQW